MEPGISDDFSDKGLVILRKGVKEKIIHWVSNSITMRYIHKRYPDIEGDKIHVREIDT